MVTWLEACWSLGLEPVGHLAVADDDDDGAGDDGDFGGDGDDDDDDDDADGDDDDDGDENDDRALGSRGHTTYMPHVVCQIT